MKSFICIECPRGCNLVIDDNNNVTGNACNRGKIYAINEVSNPQRIVTSTVKINSSELSRLPVITSSFVPKNMMFEVIKQLNSVNVNVPVYCKDVIIKNVCGLNVDIVATRTVLK